MQDILNDKTINNVIEKLQTFMVKNNLTMHGVATTLGFAYQPFYRMMIKKSLPTLSSLETIAANLKCTISELTNDNIFLDVPSFDGFDSYLQNKFKQDIRIYLPYSLFLSNINNDFFAIEIPMDPIPADYINDIKYLSKKDLFQVYIKKRQIDNDGYFLLKFKNEIRVLEVTSASNTTVIVNLEKIETKIPVNELEVYAKFFSFVELPRYDQKNLFGICK